MQAEVQAPDDKAYFRELEAIYVLRVILLTCTSSLEICAYEYQNASPLLTAKLQSMPHIKLRLPDDLSQFMCMNL